MPVLRPRLMVMVVGSLVLSGAGCGGDEAKKFGGGGTGGVIGGSGGANGASGGVDGASGGATGASGGRIGATGGDTAATGGQGGAAGEVSASGGASATGGTGTGGVTATGGGRGSGGRVGSGGTAAGTGGGPGSGGAAAGTGGGFGSTGGSVGSGGAGSGGRTGTGGAAAMCNALATDYQSALPAAKACNTITGLTVPQCQTMTSAALGCGSTCTIYVQDSTKLTDIHNRWNALACQSMIGACPAIACLDGKPGNCYASAGSTTAQCQIAPN